MSKEYKLWSQIEPNSEQAKAKKILLRSTTPMRDAFGLYECVCKDTDGNLYTVLVEAEHMPVQFLPDEYVRDGKIKPELLNG